MYKNKQTPSLLIGLILYIFPVSVKSNRYFDVIVKEKGRIKINIRNNLIDIFLEKGRGG